MVRRTDQIAIAFVDDHPALLDGLASIFAGYEDFTVVAKGSSAADAVAIPVAVATDVIILDLNMRGDAFQAIARIAENYPDTKIIAFTASLGVEHAIRALDAGANGYVVKGSTVRELVEAIHVVRQGETYISQSFASKVINALRDASVRKKAAQAIRLSVREDQIVALLLRGRTNKEIARQLQITEKTVKHYMTILMQKLNARNRVEAVLAAQKIAADSPDSLPGHPH